MCHGRGGGSKKFQVHPSPAFLNGIALSDGLCSMVSLCFRWIKCLNRLSIYHTAKCNLLRIKTTLECRQHGLSSRTLLDAGGP